MKMNIKQKKIKIEPKIELQHIICTEPWLSRLAGNLKDLSSSVNMYVLLTVLYIIVRVLVGRISFTHQNYLNIFGDHFLISHDLATSSLATSSIITPV